MKASQAQPFVIREWYDGTSEGDAGRTYWAGLQVEGPRGKVMQRFRFTDLDTPWEDAKALAERLNAGGIARERALRESME